MNLVEDFTYAILSPTSMGVRLTPVDRQPVYSGDMFQMTASSAETNVLSVSSFLGLPVKVLTCFIKNSPVAQLIKDNLARRHIQYEGPEINQGGPWGFRHQFNIADSGFGYRGPRVHNDRSGEVGKLLNVENFDLETIFGEQKVAFVHISGLNAALSTETGKFNLEIARVAKKYGTRISFDLNYRASFWDGRKEELSAIFREISSLADVLVGNEEDFQLCLGIPGPDAGGRNLSAKIESFKEMIYRVKKKYSNASVFTTTLREVINANRHLWGGIMLCSNRWHVIEPREIEVYDRIGGGDGFVGGLLYGIIKKWDPYQWLQFAWATGTLAVTLATDYVQPADEEQVWSIWEGNARVTR